VKGIRSVLTAALLIGASMQANAFVANFADGFGIGPLQTTAGGINCGQAADQCGQPLVYANLGGSGVNLTVSGFGPGQNFFVWHDVVPEFGGLGASNNARDGNSDNLFAGEGVILDLDAAITITKWYGFNHAGGSASAVNGAEYTLMVDGLTEVNDALVTGGQNGMGLNGGAGYMGSQFKWENTGPDRGLFYVSAFEFTVDVPEPASMAMLAIGLLTLGATKRLRRV
jgi:hypothetical protein